MLRGGPYDCLVCNSKTSETLHFGGQCCKRCAAFFRRSVALNLKYPCNTKGKCEFTIGTDMRTACRKCRYDRCISAGMEPDLVKSLPGSHEKKRKIQMNMNEPAKPQPQCSNDVPGLRASSFHESTESSREQSIMSPSASFSELSSIHNTPSSIITRIIENEMQSNRRKRIVYTTAPLEGIFSEICRIPFRKEDLSEINLKDYTSYCRQDASIVMDYVRNLPGVDTMVSQNKEHTFHIACYVDGLFSSAYYSWQLGFPEQFVVMWNGTFIRMDPLPPTGREPQAISAFANQEEHFKYTSIIPFEIQKWQELILPLKYLNLTFEEIALLKALTIYQMCYFKYTDEARQETSKQKDLIIIGIFELCKNNGMSSEEANVRVGELLLAISLFLPMIIESIASYLRVSFFGLFSCDISAKESSGQVIDEMNK